MSTLSQDQSRLLSESEVAEILGVCKRTVWQMRKEGKLRCVKIKTSVRYTREELNRFIEAQSTALSES